MSAEGGRQFVDSNVLVYAHDLSAGERHERASDLVASLWRTGTGALSVQVLQEFLVNITLKVARPLSVAEARRRVSDFARWRTHEPLAADVLDAIDIHRDYKVSFWDAMIVRSASELGCDVLWSEDFNPGQTYRGVRAEDPLA